MKLQNKPRGRPFLPGNAGRPPGSKNKTTQALEHLAAGHAEEVIQKVIQQARDGDVASQRMVLDRIYPVRKGQPVDIDLPPIKTIPDVLAAIPLLWDALAAGRLTPDEVTSLSLFAERTMTAIHLQGVHQRIDALEEKLAPLDEERASDEEKFDRRLEAIERQNIKNQEGAERAAFLAVATITVIACHVGGLQPKGNVFDAYARALKYRDTDDLCGDLVRSFMGEVAAVWRIQLRHELALRAVFTKFQYELRPQDKFEEGLTAIAEQLPAEWIAQIDEVVDQVDYVKQRQQEKEVDRILTAIAEGRTSP